MKSILFYLKVGPNEIYSSFLVVAFNIKRHAFNYSGLSAQKCNIQNIIKCGFVLA